MKMDKALTKRKADRMETTKSKVSWLNRTLDVSIRNHNQGTNEPIMYHSPGIPKSRQTPFSFPSLSRPQIVLHLSITSTPQTLRICSRGSPNLKGERNMTSAITAKRGGDSSHSTTSAASSLPLLNLIPVSMKRSIRASFLSLILPSAIN